MHAPTITGQPASQAVTAGQSVTLAVTASDPAQEALIPVPLPEVDEGQNISYAVQWLLFAGVAMAGWFFFLQREAREDAMAGALADAKGQ